MPCGRCPIPLSVCPTFRAQRPAPTCGGHFCCPFLEFRSPEVLSYPMCCDARHYHEDLRRTQTPDLALPHCSNPAPSHCDPSGVTPLQCRVCRVCTIPSDSLQVPFLLCPIHLAWSSGLLTNPEPTYPPLPIPISVHFPVPSPPNGCSHHHHHPCPSPCPIPAYSAPMAPTVLIVGATIESFCTHLRNSPSPGPSPFLPPVPPPSPPHCGRVGGQQLRVGEGERAGGHGAARVVAQRLHLVVHRDAVQRHVDVHRAARQERICGARGPRRDEGRP